MLSLLLIKEQSPLQADLADAAVAGPRVGDPLTPRRVINVKGNLGGAVYEQPLLLAVRPSGCTVRGVARRAPVVDEALGEARLTLARFADDDDIARAIEPAL